MEWTDHKPYLRLHKLPVEEFAATTMVVRLDFASLESLGTGATAADPAKSTSAQ